MSRTAFSIADERTAWKFALTSIPVPGTPPAMPRAPARLAGPWSTSPTALRDSIVVSLARTTVGSRYVLGGASLDRGFDCSGLVRHIMTALHVDVPRTSSQQAVIGAPVARDTSALRPGDVLAFSLANRGVSHVGVYIGDGRYVHASSVAGRVIESRLDRPRASMVKDWRGARRVLPREPTERSAD
ncbi:MAG: NlpC/P60 family protein [Gemmatimonadaceae bacterium]